MRLLLQRFDLLAGFGQPAFTLVLLQLGVEPRAHAVTHQAHSFFALRQRAPRHHQLGLGAGQLDVAAGHVAGQQHTGGLGVCLGGVHRA